MKLKTEYMVLFLIFIVLLVYYPVISAPILSVDDQPLFNWLLNLDGFNLKGIFLPGGVYYYRPILMSTYVADKYLWGLDESFMHLENILFHLLNVILVFFIARKVYLKSHLQNSTLPLAAALLFALHPLNTEAVNWIAGRTDLVAGTFLLLSLLTLIIALETNSPYFAGLTAILLLMGCLSKETVLFFLPGAFLIILSYDKRVSFISSELYQHIRFRFGYYLAVFTPFLSYLLIRYLAFANHDAAMSRATTAIFTNTGSNWLYSLKIALKVPGFYLKKLFFPWPLNFAIISISDYYVLFGCLLVLVCVYLLYKRDLIASFFLAAVGIGSSALVVALGRIAWTGLGERYMYIPTAIFSIAIVAVTFNLFKKVNIHKNAILMVPVVVFFAGFAYATVERNFVWQDDLTLFEDTAKKSPDFPFIKNELAGALKRHGKIAAGNNLLRTNIAPEGLRGGDITILSRSALLSSEDDYEGARAMLLAKLDPADQLYPSFLKQLILINEKRITKAAVSKQKEILAENIDLLIKLQATSGDPFYYYRIGNVYMHMKKNASARKYFLLAYQNAPSNAYYREPARKLAEKFSP